MSKNMTKYLYEKTILNKIRGKIKKKYIFLFLDYDGTLAEFHHNPDKAKPLRGIKKTLKKINNISAITTTIISGRSYSSLKNLIDIKNINYATTHGLEIRFDKQKKINIIEEDSIPYNTIKKVKEYLQKYKRDTNDTKIEDKKNTIAFHYSSNFDEKKLIKEIEKIIEGSKLEIIQGRKVIEIRPVYWNKGKTVKEIIKIISKEKEIKKGNYISIYIGDDRTDEDAFAALSGINIYVKNKDNLETKADYYLKNPLEVKKFLKILYCWQKDNH
ncbi:MAG: trehalose-phosphatase [Bacillota bacterium]